ncbi:spectrin beta chain, non-erythrocytic 1-like [Argopecten irradians]|uniref:spectrin beta chain, non-erythrocytic 1-like n=1 Tax=Argopecten irradians TaxID=31199 RepID=UPI0037139249
MADAQQTTGTESVAHESELKRKHEWVTLTEKGTYRCWDKAYMVLSGNTMTCYRERKKRRDHIHYEPILSLANATCAKALDYTKRPYVFRLRLASGSEFLFQATDEAEMESWIAKIGLVTEAKPSAAEMKESTKKLHQNEGFMKQDNVTDYSPPPYQP